MATRYSGNVQIRLTYYDDDQCYHGKVKSQGHTYSICVGAPAAGYGPGIAYDSSVAYDRASHAALSFAANDADWGEGEYIFSSEAESGFEGWIIRRRKNGPVAYGGRVPPCAASMGCLCALHSRGGEVDAACNAVE